jgi:uncharacterized protein (DUF2267 family)
MPQPVDEMLSRVRRLVGPPSADALLSRHPEEKVARPEPPAATMPARLEGRPISYREFISAVQVAGELETPREAGLAATAVLGELGGCLSWPVARSLGAYLPRPVRQLLSRRSFASSMSRFSPRGFVKGVAEQERVDLKRAAHDARAVLLALDQTLPEFLADQLHRELASLWGPLTLPLES